MRAGSKGTRAGRKGERRSRKEEFGEAVSSKRALPIYLQILCVLRGSAWRFLEDGRAEVCSAESRRRLSTTAVSEGRRLFARRLGTPGRICYARAGLIRRSHACTELLDAVKLMLL
jgi:hypothetical protein